MKFTVFLIKKGVPSECLGAQFVFIPKLNNSTVDNNNDGYPNLFLL